MRGQAKACVTVHGHASLKAPMTDVVLDMARHEGLLQGRLDMQLPMTRRYEYSVSGSGQLQKR